MYYYLCAMEGYDFSQKKVLGRSAEYKVRSPQFGQRGWTQDRTRLRNDGSYIGSLRPVARKEQPSAWKGLLADIHNRFILSESLINAAFTACWTRDPMQSHEGSIKSRERIMGC